MTTVPVGFTGNVFIGGLAFQPPAGLNLANAKVQWQGVFSGTNVSFTLQWQWAAGIYSNLGTSALGSSAFYNALGVKPIANNTGSTYLNNDNAGTPENFKADYTSSLSGQGEPSSQSQYTGQYGHPANAYYQAYLLNE